LLLPGPAGTAIIKTAMTTLPAQGIPLRKTKIVSTIGPSSIAPAVVKSLLEAGMNVARINASHGTMEEHAQYVEILRREAKKKKLPLALLLDLPGPKDRTGKRAWPRAGLSAAHARARLPLLPSGPGGIHRFTLRGAQPPARRP